MDFMYPMVCVSIEHVYVNLISLCLILFSVAILFIGKNIKPKNNIILAIIFLITTILSIVFQLTLSLKISLAIITLYFFTTYKLEYSKKILFLSILFLSFSLFTAIFFKTPFAIIFGITALFLFLIRKPSLSKIRFLVSLFIIIIACLFLIEKITSDDCLPGYMKGGVSLKNNLMPNNLLPNYFSYYDYKLLIRATLE